MSDLMLKPLSKRLRSALAKSHRDDGQPHAGGRMEVRAAADAGTVELLIYGNIGASWWDDESVTAKSVVEALRDADASTIEVRINSYGGSVSDGVAIHNELRRQAGKGVAVNVTVDGVACSIASLIAAAGDTVRMPTNALQMLHAPWGALYVDGNAKQIREAAEEFAAVLEVFGKAMSGSYARKSGKPASNFDAMWESGKDYWYSAEEAKEFGLCDAVLDAAEGETNEEDDASALAAELVAAAPKNLARRIHAALRVPAPTPARKPNSPAASASAHQPAMPGVTTEESAMTEAEIKAAAKKAADEALAALRTRNEDIRAIAEPHMNNASVKAYVDKVVAEADLSVSADNVGRHILSLMATGAGPLNGNAGIVAGGDQRDMTRKAMANAIQARVGMANAEADNPYRGHSMSELARECLAQAGVNTRGLDKREIVGLAFTHSTSDFPGLLGDTARKSVLKGYEEAEEQIDQFTRPVSVSDFKPTNLVGLGAFSDLLVVPEGGEFKYGTFSEQSQAMRLVTYGRLFSITRQAVINDDLGIFNDVPRKLGQAARRTIAKAVFELINSNPVLADGKTLFHADHGNLLAAAAISTLSVDAMRVAMGSQKDPDGNTIAVPLKTLLTPLALGGLARTVRDSTTEVSGSKNLTTPNIVRNTFDVVDDARLDASSSSAWYGIANSAFVDGIVIGYLDGIQTPYLEQQEGFTVDGVAWKVRLDAAPAIADYRGIYKNPGV